MPYVVYDAGALVAAERKNLEFLFVHRGILADGHEVVVPLPAYVQVFRGDPRQHGLHKLMRDTTLHRADKPIADLAGRALHRTATSDAVDAIVAATAVVLSAPVITSDPKDLSTLLVALEASHLPVRQI